MEKILPTNKEHWLKLRSMDITSTDVSSLFGLSPYKTFFELWHEKRDAMPCENDENEAMRIGRLVEPAIAKLIIEKYFPGSSSTKIEEYYRIPEKRLGSSFDHLLVSGDGTSLMEIKMVDRFSYGKYWTRTDAPEHVELQLQHQMLVGGFSKGYIVALVGGNTLPEPIERKYDSKIGDAIEKKAEQFWLSIENNQEPDPDWDRDSSLICSMMSFADPGKSINSDEEIDSLVNEHFDVSGKISALELSRKSIKAKILQKIGDAERVEGSGYRISAQMIGPSEIKPYVRKAFRQFKVYRRASK